MASELGKRDAGELEQDGAADSPSKRQMYEPGQEGGNASRSANALVSCLPKLHTLLPAPRGILDHEAVWAAML